MLLVGVEGTFKRAVTKGFAEEVMAELRPERWETIKES